MFTARNAETRLRMLEERLGIWRLAQQLYGLGPLIASVGVGFLAADAPRRMGPDPVCGRLRGARHRYGDVVVVPLPASRPVRVRVRDAAELAVHEILGWMRFPDIGSGSIFASKAAGKLENSAWGQLALLGMHFVHLPDFETAQGVFNSANQFQAINDDKELSLWRWSNLIERWLLHKLLATAKSDTSAKGPREVLSYHRLVNDGLFFERDLLARVLALYEAYQSHPQLSLGCAAELEGESFDQEPFESGVARKRLGSELLAPKSNLIQAAFYAEHRARLAIMKSAIDLIDQQPETVDMILPGPSMTLRRGNTSLVLPASFQEGLRWLRKQASFSRYAYLWQTFMWTWGGFYLQHRAPEEFEMLSVATGVPASEVPTALEAYDRFFPVADGWFAQPGATSSRLLKMMPMVFMGLGAHRRRVSLDLSDYSSLGNADYTEGDLTKWTNYTLAFVETSPYVSAGEAADS